MAAAMRFTIDAPETGYELRPPHLLPVATAPAAMRRAALDRLQALDAGALDGESLRRRSLAAFMLLTAGEAERALELLGPCAVAQQAAGLPRDRVATELRQVQALQALGRADDAATLAATVVARCRDEPALFPLLHYALHHLGKALAQAGRPQDAARALHEALALRRGLDQPGLLASTQAALELVQPAADAAEPARTGARSA